MDAALAAMARRHALHRLARAEERAGDVGGEHALEARGLHVVEAGLALEDAGVVHEDGHGAELATRRVEYPDHVGFPGHVALDRDGAAAGVLDLLHDGFGGLRAAQVVHAHRVTLSRRKPCGRGADAARAPGHDHHAGMIFL